MNVSQFAARVGFGTSGVRALVSDLNPSVVWVYTRAFVARLRETGQLHRAKTVVLGWDLRPSSPRIASVIASALRADGLSIDWAGRLPTPALALRCLNLGSPGIMVTGSHIPFDRNGIKFYSATGEILKADETAISHVDVGPLLPVQRDLKVRAQVQADVEQAQTSDCASAALNEYRQRYVDLLPSNALKGLRIGVYQHSAVGRDLLVDLLVTLGACVVPLERSETFVPIDTEAISPSDETRAAGWCQQHKLNAVISTDGDGDRPWVCDEKGSFVRGDVLGTLTALWLGVQTVVTPVSSNTVLERSGQFQHTLRTRIGSPYVIEAMQNLQARGHCSIAGFEANGGFLLQTSLKGLQPLPTRDSVLPILAILTQAQAKCLPVSALPGLLPARYTHSDRLQALPTAQSHQFIKQLASDPSKLFTFVEFAGSPPTQQDSTDGLRITLANGEIIHLRPSGNAPEMRCYAESDTPAKARRLVQTSLLHVQGLLT